MTKKEMLKLEKLETDDQNDMAIVWVNEYICAKDINNPELNKLTDLVLEFEERTDILNRDFKI